jgi:hypothetical protein
MRTEHPIPTVRTTTRTAVAVPVSVQASDLRLFLGEVARRFTATGLPFMNFEPAQVEHHVRAS